VSLLNRVVPLPASPRAASPGGSERNNRERGTAGIEQHEYLYMAGWRGVKRRGYLSPMPGIDTLIPRFKAADRATRLETLLDYSRKLPPLPERLELEKARGDHRVHECQTPVFLWVEVEDGQVHIHADVPRESPTVRGFVSLLARSLDGAPPEAVAKVPDDLLDQLGLSETLGMTRTQGLTAILHRIKRTVAAA
jgi:cysteine desulfuration protein SufE